MLEGATSSQAAVKELLGERQLWWKCCAEAVRADPAWFAGKRAGELAAWLDATAPDRAGGPVSSALQTYLLGRALSPPEDRAEDHDEDLARLRETWRSSGLLSHDAMPRLGQPSGGQSGGLPPEITARLDDVREQIARLRPHTEGGGPEPSGPGNVLVIAALLMAGAEVRKRPVVRVPVVFGQSATGPDRAAPEQGVTGVLELREFPAGPAGLYPDPRAMAGTHSPNGQFATAVGRAWRAAGAGREGRCVLWRIVLSDDPLPPPRIEGPSLGVAFALGLREILRHPRSRRPSGAWIRGAFYGLRPRTAVTGALGVGDGEHLLKISGMEVKLLTARRKGLRLVAPEANRADVAHAPEPGDVRFAATLKQADRYARQFRTGWLVTALALVAAASLAGLAVYYHYAEAKTRLENAHRLADVSQSLVSSDVGLAELFAVQAYRQHADALTRHALFQAVTTSPHLVGSVRASGTVSALGTTPNGGALLAGTQGGEVERWTVTAAAASRRKQVGRISGQVTAVASDASGNVVAAIGHDSVRVWKDDAPAPTPVLPARQQPTAVGVSPSGRFVVVTTTTGSFDVPPTAWVLDRSTGATGRLDLADMDYSAPDAIAFSDDSHLMLFDGGGTWEELTVPGPVRTRGSTMNFGNQNYASALAPDGSHLTYSTGASFSPVWVSEGSPDIEKPPLRARFPEGVPAALALSRGGTRAAAALGTSLYVSRTSTPDQPPSEPLVLPGAGAVPAGGLAFLGPSGHKLVSAAGDLLTLWDLDRLSRIATQTTVVAEPGCNACLGPRLALTPDGRTAAVLSGNGVTLDVRSLDPADAGRPSAVRPQSLDKEYGAVVWNADGSRVITVSEDGSALIFDPSNEMRVTGRWRALPNPLQLDDAPALLQFLPGGREVAQLDASGTIRIREPATGRVLRQTAGPRDMAPTVNATYAGHQGEASLDRLAAHAALVKYDDASSHREIRVVDAATGSYHVIDATGFQGLAYADDQLLVQRTSGDLEVWSPDGARRLGTLEGTPGTSVGPVVGKGLIAAIPGNENTVQLLDRPSGDVLGTLPIPAGPKSISTGLAFSVDGTRLVTATEFRRAEGDADTVEGVGTLISWRLDPNSWISAACSSAGRELTPALWKQYLGSDAPSSLRCAP
ncbi:WD40 repeat domain-containing protein [Streptomyces sp. NPDC102394]|uniref:WD40 repeat domain-containing protein n=1 Tax=Streptomyces sp. NPDC102394 TaxID=3366167 RepID=UPI00381B1EF7